MMRFSLRLKLFAGIWLLSGSPARSDVFDPVGLSVAVGQPHDVIFGDLNLDGDLDLAVSTNDGIWIRAGAGGGAFAATGEVLGAEFRRAVLGDVDGDGYLDLVSSRIGGSNVLHYRNDGNGLFGVAIQSLTTVGAGYPRLGDLNGDGDLDLLISSEEGVRIYLGDGSGLLSSTALTIGSASNARPVEIGDIDMDGDLDFVVLSQATLDPPSSINVRFNDGLADFSGVSAVLVPSCYVIKLADVDGDGDLDLVATGSEAPVCAVRRNDGAGSFTAGLQDVPLGPWSSISVVIGDVDRDGLPDLLSAGLYSLTCRIRRNLGGGVFDTTGETLDVSPGTAPLSVKSLSFATSVNLADVDRDGDLDVAVALLLGSGHYIGIYFNTNSNFRRGDSSGDGAIDLADPIAVLSRLFKAGIALECDDAADMNDDGTIDIADPVFGLTHMFSGGPDFPPPFGICGPDPTADALTCTSHPACFP